MTRRWTCLAEQLPPPIEAALKAVPEAKRQQTQEVRLRCGAPLCLSGSAVQWELPLVITAALLKEAFFRLCGQAVHTHQEELRQGFVTAEGGFRVGVAGTAVMRGNDIVSYRSLTSLCIRIPCRASGCSLPLLQCMERYGANGLLLCGAPSTGKTTLLRDLAYQLSTVRRVCVVDERFELSADGLMRCDVLRGCPKADGMLQAVRTLAPDVMIVDELGSEAEWCAVTECLFCGVGVIASAHITAPSDLCVRPFAARALASGAFPLVAQLPPRATPFAATDIRKGGDYFENSGDSVARVFLRGDGRNGGIPLAAT